METQAPTYRLVRPPGAAGHLPVPDDGQRRVIEHGVMQHGVMQDGVMQHGGGPLLVLAGPGTGKTTTIVETVVDRVSRGGVDPSRVLVLTFSRKAAEELRARIMLRLGRTLRQPVALT